MTEPRDWIESPRPRCFGGLSLDRLFITTARIGLSESDLAGQPLAGGLSSCPVGVAGAAARPFVPRC